MLRALMLFLMTLLLSSSWTTPSLAAAAPTDKGNRAYRMKALRDHSAAKTSLARAAGGERLVVVVMKGSWCDVCVGQLRRLSKRTAELKKLGTRVVGLNTDAPSANRSTAKKNGLPFQLLSDAKHRVLDALGLWRADWGHPLPALVVFDRCGVERARLEGRRPRRRPDASLFEFLRKLDEKPEQCGQPNA